MPGQRRCYVRSSFTTLIFLLESLRLHGVLLASILNLRHSGERVIAPEKWRSSFFRATNWLDKALGEPRLRKKSLPSCDTLALSLTGPKSASYKNHPSTSHSFTTSAPSRTKGGRIPTSLEVQIRRKRCRDGCRSNVKESTFSPKRRYFWRKKYSHKPPMKGSIRRFSFYRYVDVFQSI